MPIRSVPTLVTAPAAEPVTSTEAKLWCKVDHTDDDTIFTSLIAAAREAAEKYTRRSFITQTWKLTVDAGNTNSIFDLPPGVYDLPVSALNGELPREIDLPYGNLLTISSVKYYDLDNTEATLSSTNYLADTANNRLVLNYAAVWPSNLRNKASIAITYTAGYGAAGSAVPESIKTAIKMHIQKMYDERMVCDMPEGCKNLLQQYRFYA